MTISVMGCGGKNNTSTTETNKVEQSGTEIIQEQTSEVSIWPEGFEGEGLNKEKKVRIGGTATGYIKLVNGKDGFAEKQFEKYGYEVEWYEFTNGPEMIEALATGSLDIAYGIGDSPIISGLANGYDLKAIALGPHNKYSTGIAIREGLKDSVNSLSDLKGLKVALAVGTTNEDFITRELNSVGLTTNDIEVINIKNANDQLNALLRGEIDAAINIEPNITRIANETNGKKLDYGEPLKVSYGYAVSTNDYLEKNPKAAAIFVSVFEHVKSYIDENRDEYKNVYAEATGYDIGILDYINELEFTSLFNEDVEKSLSMTAEFMGTAGLTDHIVDITDRYTNKYIDAASILQE